MPDEQPNEEIKTQSEAVKAATESFTRSLLKAIESGELRIVRYAGERKYSPPFGLSTDALPVFKALVFIDEQDKGEFPALRLGDSVPLVDSHEEVALSLSGYLAEIDQSREKAQATQAVINQLRTETKELISKLFAA